MLFTLTKVRCYWASKRKCRQGF